MTEGGKKGSSGAEMDTIPWLVRLLSKFQPEERIDWYIVVCGDEARDGSVPDVAEDGNHGIEDDNITDPRK
ncbi:hypothetical protein Micbo1qcDRAFT_47455 [Microdochium bolleyi]|uniref:Uncharacterized protein n=1 Tax=Microdochium bolleyi TaxID=196109 RepID=A0A136IME5_9PEZI|nr:hypothetical protein Micbo1qcDRAFT_47455 [Microdochium bolleyi]